MAKKVKTEILKIEKTQVIPMLAEKTIVDKNPMWDHQAEEADTEEGEEEIWVASPSDRSYELLQMILIFLAFCVFLFVLWIL